MIDRELVKHRSRIVTNGDLMKATTDVDRYPNAIRHRKLPRQKTGDHPASCLSGSHDPKAGAILGRRSG